MKIKTLIFFGFFLTTKLFSQYGIIEDKDGYVNARSEPSTKGKIVDTFQNGRIIYFLDLDDEKTDWLDCTYSVGKGQRGGYIHKSRIKLVTSYEKIKPMLSKNTITFKNDSISIIIKVEPFVAKNYKLEWRKSNPKDKNSNSYLATINGKEFLGCDGSIPREKYGNSTIVYHGKTSTIPTERYYNPNIDYHELFWDKDKNIYYLTTTNSDGAGGYVAMWVIKNGQTIKRYDDIPF